MTTTAPHRTATPAASTRRRSLFNRTYLGLELKRVLRDPITLFFTTALPAFFYVVFGATQDWGGFPIGNGNVAMYTMIGMAAYGAATATTALGSMAAVERSQGWGRQLGLTPMREGTFVLTKVLLATLIGTLPVVFIYSIGAFTAAEARWDVWLVSGLIVIGGALLLSLYGLVFGLAIRSESAASAASGSLVILGFLGNVFTPLSGWLLDVARFTPLYGYVSLARRPLTEGLNPSMDGGLSPAEPLWVPLLNVGAWTFILASLCLILVRLRRGRP